MARSGDLGYKLADKLRAAGLAISHSAIMETIHMRQSGAFSWVLLADKRCVAGSYFPATRVLRAKKLSIFVSSPGCTPEILPEDAERTRGRK